MLQVRVSTGHLVSAHHQHAASVRTPRLPLPLFLSRQQPQPMQLVTWAEAASINVVPDVLELCN